MTDTHDMPDEVYLMWSANPLHFINAVGPANNSTRYIRADKAVSAPDLGPLCEMRIDRADLYKVACEMARDDKCSAFWVLDKLGIKLDAIDNTPQVSAQGMGDADLVCVSCGAVATLSTADDADMCQKCYGEFQASSFDELKTRFVELLKRQIPDADDDLIEQYMYASKMPALSAQTGNTSPPEIEGLDAAIDNATKAVDRFLPEPGRVRTDMLTIIEAARAYASQKAPELSVEEIWKLAEQYGGAHYEPGEQQDGIEFDDCENFEKFVRAIQSANGQE